MKSILIVAVALSATGCASITEDHTQPITVQTVHENREVGGVGCTLTNDAGSWFVTSPASAWVQKSTGDLTIFCKRDAYSGNQTLVSKSNTAVWGNILIGGIIGYVVDRNTGAGFDYPQNAMVTLHRYPPLTPISPTTAAPEDPTNQSAK